MPMKSPNLIDAAAPCPSNCLLIRATTMSDTALCSTARFILVEEKSYESALLPLRSRRELVLTAKSSVLIITDLLRLPAGPSGDILSNDA